MKIQYNITHHNKSKAPPRFYLMQIHFHSRKYNDNKCTDSAWNILEQLHEFQLYPSLRIESISRAKGSCTCHQIPSIIIFIVLFLFLGSPYLLLGFKACVWKGQDKEIIADLRKEVFKIGFRYSTKNWR